MYKNGFVVLILTERESSCHIKACNRRIKKQKEEERNEDMKELLDLFWTFAKMGAVTFGGGYAMLPIIQREVVEKRHWATEEEVMDYYAIGQCTPGIIAVNTSTFIGYKIKGIIGGFVATMGFVFPSLIIITIIAMFLQNFADIVWVKYAFNGIRACVCALILDAVIKLGKKSIVDPWCVVIVLLVLGFSLFADVSPILIVIAAAVLGVVLKALQRKAGKKA